MHCYLTSFTKITSVELMILPSMLQRSNTATNTFFVVVEDSVILAILGAATQT